MKLLAISDRRVIGADPIAAIAGLMAREGSRLTVQIREKDLDARVLLEWIRALLPLRNGAALMINDRADVARCFGGELGVQLPENGLSIAEARAVLGDRARIGRSVHDLPGAVRAAREGAQLITLSPIFETPSKPGVRALGVEVVREVARAIPESVELYGLGGVDRGRAREVIDAGATGVAGIRMFWG